ELAAVGAGVRARAGGDRPGEDRELAERDQAANGPDAEAVLGWTSLARLVPRAPGEGEGGVEQEHREDEVSHDEPGSEVVLDDERAEDRLADDPDRQQGAEQGEVPAERAPAPGEDAGGDHREPDE